MFAPARAPEGVGFRTEEGWRRTPGPPRGAHLRTAATPASSRAARSVPGWSAGAHARSRPLPSAPSGAARASGSGGSGRGRGRAGAEARVRRELGGGLTRCATPLPAAGVTERGGNGKGHVRKATFWVQFPSTPSKCYCCGPAVGNAGGPSYGGQFVRESCWNYLVLTSEQQQ